MTSSNRGYRGAEDVPGSILNHRKLGHVDIVHYRERMNSFLKRRIDQEAVCLTRNCFLKFCGKSGRREGIERRFSPVRHPDDFLMTDEGLDRLDAICMMLIAIGESLKNLDKLTDGELLARYPAVDWKGAKGARDIISHHYFDLNAEAVFGTCQDDIPNLAATFLRI